MAERFEIMEKALLKMLEEKKYIPLREMLSTMNPSDVAIPIGFRNVQEIATPVCALVRNDIFRRRL